MEEKDRYEDIPRLVRELREAAGRTQEEFASDLGAFGKAVSRFTIIRIEKGRYPLGKELAAALDAYAESRRLQRHDFLSRVTQLRARSVDGKRGVHLARLLGGADLTEIYVVMCDDTEFAYHVRSGLAATTRLARTPSTTRVRIVLVVPSRARIVELFGRGEGSEQHGHDDLHEGYADRLGHHLVGQIQRFQRIAGQTDGAELDVYESDAVFNSVVLAKGAGDARCAYWPCVPLQRKQDAPDLTPAVAGSDVAIWHERLIKSMIDVDRGIARKHHLGDVFAVDDGVERQESGEHSGVTPMHRVAFSRCLPRRKVADYVMDAGEGLAVASILPYVRTVRRGKPVVEVLLKRRSRVASGAEKEVDDQLAFISSRVTAPAIWDAISAAAGETTGGPPLDVVMHVDEQSARVHDRLRRLVGSGRSDSDEDSWRAVLDCAYKNAAVSELAVTYGLGGGVPFLVARLEPGGLEDCRIDKPGGGAIVPRLFTLSLKPEERDELERRARQNDGNELERLAVDDLIKIIDRVDEAEPGGFDDFLNCALTDDLQGWKFRETLIGLRDGATLGT